MTDHLTQLVRAFAESAYNESGDRPVPMATTDADEVIKAQLTENTGTHFLDSGAMFGRHWEENKDNPPWEKPEWDVDGWGFVTQNVYDFMQRRLDRDRTCVALEAALYAFSHTDERKSDPWLVCQEAFAESLLAGRVPHVELIDLGVPVGLAEDVMGLQAELSPDTGHAGGDPGPFTCNTYNLEFGCPDQVLQGTNLGGPYAEYVMLQVHQGADVRGGYTGPRVYKAWDYWVPGELYFQCDRCDWEEAESCLPRDGEELMYQDSVDPFELEDSGWLEPGDEEHPALEAAYDAEYIDGAVFHRCGDEPGEFGHVTFM